MIAWFFVLQKAKLTKQGGTRIKSGMFMPHLTSLQLVPFLPWQRICFESWSDGHVW